MYSMKRELYKTSFRLTVAAKKMLHDLSEERGLSMTGVLETIIREAHSKIDKKDVVEGGDSET